MRETNIGQCEHCAKQFGYYLIHSGFNDSLYAYCNACGMTADFSIYSKRFPKLIQSCEPFREICAEMEPYIQPCECGGAFKKGSSPRCPHCKRALSAETAAAYIEINAAGTRKGWGWQENWSDCYCIVIENKVVTDNFRPTP